MPGRSLVVPLEATQTSTAVWVGVTGEPSPTLQVEVGTSAPLTLGPAWQRWVANGLPAFASQRVNVQNLPSGAQIPVRLVDGATTIATATATTLPVHLPSLDQPPFIALLGSCFAHEKDGGAAAATYAGLPAGARPSVSILCGDQVYLDAPFPRFLLNDYGPDDLRAIHLQTYMESWGLLEEPGMGPMLTNGATYFSSDDHEYWNNAPERGWVVRNTWFEPGRTQWHDLAQALYDTFQSSGPVLSLDVPPLSIRSVDTRRSRTSDQTTFMPSAELDQLGTWVDGLTGPGALVFGQVVFAPSAGWSGRFTDWGLPDFEQYEDLVRILMRSQHDLLVLTGDVHFGRISGCSLPSGASLIEIISSPLALVDPRAGGTWHGPPGMFPAYGIPGTTQREVWVADQYEVSGNHFATLEFQAMGPRVRLTVRAWPLATGGMAPAPSHTWTRDLG